MFAAHRFLVCPDCRYDLDEALTCPVCQRSLKPDPDGIITAMPRELEYAAAMNDLEAQIGGSSDSERGAKVVRFEEAFHDEQAAYYDELLSDPEPIKSYIRALIAKTIYGWIRGSEFVVDLCCGTGKGSIPLLDLGITVVGVDVSREMLRAYARKTGPRRNLLLIQADASHPPLRPDSCAAVQIIGGLHHIPDRAGCIRNCCRVLAKRGVLIVHEPIITGRAHWMLRALRNFDAITNPARVCRALGRRLGLHRPKPVAVEASRLETTPFEQPFHAPEELSAMLPEGIETAALESKMVLTDWRVGKHLQHFRPFIALVIALDQWLSRTGRAHWTGSAILGVFRKP